MINLLILFIKEKNLKIIEELDFNKEKTFTKEKHCLDKLFKYLFIYFLLYLFHI